MLFHGLARRRDRGFDRRLEQQERFRHKGDRVNGDSIFLCCLGFPPVSRSRLFGFNGLHRFGEISGALAGLDMMLDG